MCGGVTATVSHNIRLLSRKLVLILYVGFAKMRSLRGSMQGDGPPKDRSFNASPGLG